MKTHDKSEPLINALAERYKCRGVPRQVIADCFNLGLMAGLSLEQAELGVRLTIPERYGFEEYYTVHDMALRTGKTENEVAAEVQKCRSEMIERGEDPNSAFLEFYTTPCVNRLIEQKKRALGQTKDTDEQEGAK